MSDLNASRKNGIAGGVLISILGNVGIADLLQSAVLAATGTLVSFAVSYALRWFFRRPRR